MPELGGELLGMCEFGHCVMTTVQSDNLKSGYFYSMNAFK